MSLLQSLMRLLFGALGIPADGDVVTYDAAEGKVKWGASARGATPFSSFTLTEDLIVTATGGAPAAITGWTIDGVDGDCYEIYGFIKAVNDAAVSNTVGIDDNLTNSQSAILVHGGYQQASSGFAVSSLVSSGISVASSLAAGATSKSWFFGRLLFATTATSQIRVYQTSTQATLKAGSTFYYRKIHP